MANSKEIQSSRERLSRRVNVTYQFGKGTLIINYKAKNKRNLSRSNI